MRILVCMCILSGCLAAQDPAKTPPSPPSPAAKQTKKAPSETAIPKGAVETTPGFYRWTDKDGKVWKYRRTPFGVSRWPADSVDTQQSAADKQAVEAAARDPERRESPGTPGLGVGRQAEDVAVGDDVRRSRELGHRLAASGRVSVALAEDRDAGTDCKPGDEGGPHRPEGPVAVHVQRVDLVRGKPGRQVEDAADSFRAVDDCDPALERADCEQAAEIG